MNHNIQKFFKCYDSLLQVPFCEEKSVQLFRVAFFRRDFLQNPYFKITGDLLVAANKYDISDLVNFSVKFLGDNLSEENVVDVMIAAFLTDQEELFKSACKFIFKIKIDGKNVVETEAWKQLKEEKPILALKMLNKAMFKN